MSTIKRSYAKYPWSSKAAEAVSKLGLDFNLELDVKKLEKQENKSFLMKGVERVEAAILNRPHIGAWNDDLTELLSYSVARMFVEAIGDDYLRHRFATWESKRAEAFLGAESEEQILQICKNTFGWDVKKTQLRTAGKVLNYAIHFMDYLSVSSLFHATRWKAGNKVMDKGYVHLREKELTRLISEGVKLRILKRRVKINLEDQYQDELQKLQSLLEENRRDYKLTEFKGKAIEEAFPPCIKEILANIQAGQGVSHMARFALASFLLKIGMSIKKVVEVFSPTPDFRNSFAEYQVKHIAGELGGGTAYTPPSCATLKTNRLCRADEYICKIVKHPLSYYRKAIDSHRLIKTTHKKKAPK